MFVPVFKKLEDNLDNDDLVQILPIKKKPKPPPQKPKPKPGPKPDLLDSLFNGTLPNESKAMPKHQKPQSVQYREIITFDGSPDMLKTFHKVSCISCIIAPRCVALIASSIGGASHHCSQRLFRCLAFHLLSHIFSIPFHYSSMSQP